MVEAESVGRSIEETMNTNMSQSLVLDHIREARQQAAAARRVGQARHDRRRAGRRIGHRFTREV
jgi:hypothetical protein